MTAFGEYADDDTASTMKARDYKDATDLAVMSTRWPAETANTLSASFGAKQGIDNQHVDNGCPLFVPSVPYTLMFNDVNGSRSDRPNGGLYITENPDTTPCLTVAESPIRIVSPTMAVRRLTPTECERLQGFPDGHTLVTHKGKPAADGPRYKALGNSMAVNCMRWIGQRITAELAGGSYEFGSSKTI